MPMIESRTIEGGLSIRKCFTVRASRPCDQGVLPILSAPGPAFHDHPRAACALPVSAWRWA